MKTLFFSLAFLLTTNSFAKFITQDEISKLGSIKSISLDWRGSSMCVQLMTNEVNCWEALSPNEPLEGTIYDVPKNLGKVIKVSVGYEHACAIKESNELKCWGNNLFSKATPPSDLGAVIDVSTGVDHTCAITTDNEVKCWGIYRNWDFNGNAGPKLPPADLGKIKSIYSAEEQTCGITLNDEVKCWGDIYYKLPTPPKDLGKVTTVSTGRYHNCAILKNETLSCWGQGYAETAPPQELGEVIGVFAGDERNCAIKKTGEVKCWGYYPYNLPQVPSDLGQVKFIVGASNNTTCVITNENKLKCWGSAIH